jgi:hypothetical protein
MKRYALLAFAGLTALSLAACQKEETAGESPAVTAEATANPADAISATAAKLKQGDVLAVIQMSVPPKHYDRMKAEWKAKVESDPVTDEDRVEFAAMMEKLTASDAETKLFAEAEPELAKFETEMAAQMPLMIGMGQGFAMQAIQANEKLSEAQKKQAGDVVGAVSGWLQGVQFADRELAKQAIGKVAATARSLELKTLDEARALDFEPAMAKAGVAFNGLKLDETFDSVKTELVSQEGDTAKVKVNYQIFNQPLAFETDMVQIEGRWYGKDTVDQLEKELNAPADVATPDAAPSDDAEQAAPAQG